MRDTKQLRARLKTLLNNFVKHEKVETLETKIFDHVVSRRDFIVGTAKFTAVAGLLSKGILPSAWADTASDIDVNGANVHIPDALKEEVSQISRITASADMFKDSIYLRQVEVTKANSYESVLESTNLSLQAESIPQMLQSKAYKQLKQNPFTKNYGVPELVHLANNPDGRQQIEIMNDINNTKYPALVKSVYTRLPLKSGYNKVIAVNGQKHNTIENGKIISQKLVLAADVFNPSDSEYGDNSLEAWQNHIKAKDEKLGNIPSDIGNANLNQMYLLFENSAYTPQEFDDASRATAYGYDLEPVRLTNIFQTLFRDAHPEISSDTKVKSSPSNEVNLGINHTDSKNNRITIDHIGQFKDSRGNSCLYGTIRINFFWKMGFYITLDGVEPAQKGQPKDTHGLPKIQFFKLEYDQDILNSQINGYQHNSGVASYSAGHLDLAQVKDMLYYPYIHTIFTPIRMINQAPVMVMHTYTATDPKYISGNPQEPSVALHSAEVDYYVFTTDDYNKNKLNCNYADASAMHLEREGITVNQKFGLPLHLNKKDRNLVQFALRDGNWTKSQDFEELAPFWLATRNPIEISTYYKKEDNWTYTQLKAYKRFMIDALLKISTAESLLKETNSTNIKATYGLYHSTPDNGRNNPYYSIVYSSIYFDDKGIHV